MRYVHPRYFHQPLLIPAACLKCATMNEGTLPSINEAQEMRAEGYVFVYDCNQCECCYVVLLKIDFTKAGAALDFVGPMLIEEAHAAVLEELADARREGEEDPSLKGLKFSLRYFLEGERDGNQLV